MKYHRADFDYFSAFFAYVLDFFLNHGLDWIRVCLEEVGGGNVDLWILLMLLGCDRVVPSIGPVCCSFRAQQTILQLNTNVLLNSHDYSCFDFFHMLTKTVPGAIIFCEVLEIILTSLIRVCHQQSVFLWQF